ncbi:isomerase [Paenibacillus sambharensis]|uniref:Isomerase n=1 Tax=Paenibacillus sambharensis TaxID=1803190 RepID=A0A2W1LD36_9BACL|nr:PhzF family phenazine biosynthesis isomerase [Paenibacillus sambharensis]PZD97006.1 isomerase [Paenibacillus sambharensis]
MKQVQIYHYDAFSDIPGKGNPAGVVLNAENLTGEEMQAAAKAAGFNETTFILPSQAADFTFKYYTPGHEMNLCGHGTMGAISCMLDQGLIGGQSVITLETKAGILPIELLQASNYPLVMKQAAPAFKPFTGDKQALMESIGLTLAELDDSMPIVYGSTGTWTLLIPVKELTAFAAMKPENARFPVILKEMPRTSLHPFCMQTIHEDAVMHARHFSSPYSGTIEDPVTGTASGVMGAYYMTYLHPELESAELIIEQGQEMGRDGKVRVLVNRSAEQTIDVRIAGSAVCVRSFTADIG